jgi:hypothetical protein
MPEKIEITRTELKAIVAQAVEEAMNKKWITAEEEYANDKFVCQLREATATIKSTAIKTTIGAFVTLVLSGLALLIYMGKN